MFVCVCVCVCVVSKQPYLFLQERTKERLFEEDLEVVWEKGGSGLVFYTDASHWDQQDGGKSMKASLLQHPYQCSLLFNTPIMTPQHKPYQCSLLSSTPINAEFFSNTPTQALSMQPSL